MPTSYPGALDTLTNPTGSDQLSSPSHASQHANANDAIEAIEAELGTTPSASFSTVAARLTAIEKPACIRLERITSVQIIPTSTLTTVVYNSIIREDDEDGDYTANTGTGIVTINRTGWYTIAGGIAWEGGVFTGRRQLYLRRNATDIGGQGAGAFAASTEAHLQAASTSIYLSATDTVSVVVRQSSGGDLDALVSSATFLSVTRDRG
jgi:hypothetical protein